MTTPSAIFLPLWHFQKEQLCCLWSPVPGKQLLMLSSPPFWLLCKQCFVQVFWNNRIEEKWSSSLQTNGELSRPGLSTEIWVTHDSASLAKLGCSTRALFQAPTSFVFLEGSRVSHIFLPLSPFLLDVLRYLMGNKSVVPTGRALWDCFYSYCFLFYGTNETKLVVEDIEHHQ